MEDAGDATEGHSMLSSTLNPCYSSDDVLEEIKNWIQSDDNDTEKFYDDVIKHIESKIGRQLVCLEKSWSERQYVTVVMEMWLQKSFQKAFDYLDNKITDISLEMSSLLTELHFINSFEDIRRKLAGESRLRYWCDGGCQYLQLILDQKDLFKTAHRFVILVVSYFKHFKKSCTEKVFSRCMNDIAQDKDKGKKLLKFISALDEFLTHVRGHKELQDILEDENEVTAGITGRDLVKKLVELVFNHFTEAKSVSTGLLSARKKVLGLKSYKSTLPEWFNDFTSVALLNDDEWTPKLQSLTLETCKKFLLPKNEIKIKDDEGRQIIFVKGIVIFVSKVIKQMLELKRGNPNVQEVQIVGITSVHVDWHLESKDWHGINVGIVSYHIFVNGEICWDVSGLHRYIQSESSANATWFVNEEGSPTSRGVSGADFSKPGESGGNVYVVCNDIKTTNNGRWTIISDGGDGERSCVEKKKSKTKDANLKWAKEKFENRFPSMSRFNSAGESAVRTVVATLNKILPPQNRDHDADIRPEHEDSFYIEGTTEHGSRITVSYFHTSNKATRKIKKRYTLILFQGRTVRQGGFGGTITIEKLGGDMFEESCVPLTGKEKRQITSVRTGFYEALGSDGNMSKAAGDIGFIHNNSSLKYKRNSEGKFFGFDSDERLHLKFQKTKPHSKNLNSYAKLHHPEKGLNYVSIAVSSNREFYEDNSLSSDKRRMVEAVKKKAITRQSLVQHFAEIDERKQMTQSLQKMLDNPSDQNCNMGVLMMNEISNKEVQLHYQLTSQRQYHQETIGQGQYVKPASVKKHEVSRAALCSSPFQINVGRRPVDFRMKLPANKIYCIDVLPTVNGVDSALHCIFGQPNSDGLYFCYNTNKYRQRLAKFILDKGNKGKISTPVESFVLRVKSGSKDFPVASTMKDLYTKHRIKYGKKSNWQLPTDRFEKLLEEYAKFVESPASNLMITELEILASIHDITVHVYESQSYSFKLKSTLNRGYNEHLILYEPDGDWQRLKANSNFQHYCYQFEHNLFIGPPASTNSFSNLMEWSVKNGCNKQETIASLMMLDPEDGDTPDELSRLLFKWIPIKGGQQIDDDLASNIRLLSERVVEYNSRNISPIFYLHIVSKCKPHEWKYEFLLLEIEEQLTIPLKPAERKIWRDDLLHNLSDRIITLLRERLVTSTAGSIALLEPEKFEQILKMLAEESSSVSEEFLEHLGQLALNDWYYELKSKVVKRNDNTLTLRDLRKKGENNKIESATHSSVERNLTNIISLMDNKDWPYKYNTFLRDIEHNVNASNLKTERHDDESIQKLIQKWQTKGLKLNDDESLINFLHVYDYAVKKIYATVTSIKNGNYRNQSFRLRDTQKVTIITLLISTSSLTQVSTGEGKSLIVAGVAIAHALSGKKIDVIISNDVLALRDSNLSVADGGLRDIYEYFKVEVANNCSQAEDDRVKAYDSAVVYGELANFQRDYLLDSFHGRNIRGDRTFDLVIIDEVDCMLLDRGNNTLYLSHDIPGMEMLESLYVFIWEKICNTSDGLEKIKSDVLYDLYGAITKQDLETIHAPLKEKPSEKNALWDYLIEAKIIDPQGRLLVDKLGTITAENINYMENPDLNPKLIFFFRKVIERKRRIQIPSHLLSFVDRHLDTWLENALLAQYLKPDVDYVIDQDRTDTSPDLNPQVIIIDPHTGTDQTASQWDGALHQFLQLKEGCKLTLQSLKAVFISNATYIKRYKMLLGASGTLGSKVEQEFLQEKYDCKCIFVPTAFPKCFTIKTAKVLKTEQSWLEAIKEEVRLTVFPENPKVERSIVIFCRSIEKVNIVHQYLTTCLPKVRETRQIHRYIRDYEKFAFESKTLDVGHIIVATNLAGRGTDIKISKQLNENGGLHVCLAYLPENERIEEQAMGRAGRNGAPGSGIIILCVPQSSKRESLVGCEEWSIERFNNMIEERNTQERQRISRLKNDFLGIDLQEKFFSEFSKFHGQLKIELKNLKWDSKVIKAVCDSVLDKWALWLDETEDDAEFLNFECINYFLRKELIELLKLPESPSDIDWMTPARSVVVAKHLITNREKKSSFLAAACVILDRLIESNENFFYPAVHYYRSFIHTTEYLKNYFQQNKIKFIRTLRTCESNLNKHIDMQLSFLDTIRTTTKSNQITSFCVVNSYEQQKKNVIKLYEYFISSIRTLLGSHSCSVSDLDDALIAKDYEDEKVNELFETLVKSKCIISQVNDEETVPNREAAIQRVADDNGINQSSLSDCLDDIKGNNNLFNNIKGETLFRRNQIKGKKSEGLSEKKIEKELKNIQMIGHSRKEFWKYLLDEGALQDVVECAVVFESEADGIRHPGINTIDIKCARGILVQYNYSCRFKNLEENGKMIFQKAYFKELINSSEYRGKKIKFEFNKIARLDLAKLKSVDLTSFGQLKRTDLSYTKINTDEWPQIWNDLLKQNIIDEEGNLAPNKETQLFCYPQCPAYEVPVRKLIKWTFAAEIVRRQWLNAEDDPNYLEAIEILPFKPYRTIMSDLKASHVIYGAQVTEDTSLLEKTVNDISFNRGTRQCILDFLKSRQAVYVTTKMASDTFCLYPIEGDILTRNEMPNVFSELYAFILVGFDHVINMKERKFTWKLIGLASLIILSGILQTATGAVIERFGLAKAMGDVSQQGMNDICFGITALKSREEFSWYEYKKHKQKIAMEKLDPVVIRDLMKVLNAKYELKPDLMTSVSYSRGNEKIIRQQSICKGTGDSGTINQFLLVKHKIDLFLKLQDLFRSTLFEKTKNVIIKNSVEIKETLGNLYRSHGLEEAQKTVKTKMKELVDNSFDHSLEVAVKAWDQLLEKQFLKEDDTVTLRQERIEGAISEINDNENISSKRIRENFGLNMGISVITRKQMTCINKFHAELRDSCSPKSESSTTNYFDDEERQRFQRNVMVNIKAEFARNAEKLTHEMMKYFIHNHNAFT